MYQAVADLLKSEQFTSVALNMLTEMLQSRPNMGALRLVLIGISRPYDDESKTTVGFADVEDQFRLFVEAIPPKIRKPLRNDKSIRRVALGLVGSGRDPLLASWIAIFVASYLLENRPIMDRPLVQEGLSIWNFPEEFLSYATGSKSGFLQSKINAESSSSSAVVDQNSQPFAVAVQRMNIVNRELRNALGVSPRDLPDIGRAIFHEVDEDKARSLSDRSYYVAYRYSTERAEFVKTFLAINGPGIGAVESYSFTHIYKAKNDWKRISRGAVVGFQKTIYLLGRSARVIGGQDDKTQGLKVIALPMDEFNYDSAVVPGIYMSNALRWEPIVGRLALLHLGFESEIGRKLTDDEINPRAFASEAELHEDIKIIFKMNQKLGAHKTTEGVTKFVLDRINNFPFCDIVDSNSQAVKRAIGVEDLMKPKA